MGMKRLIESLHPLERKIIPHVGKEPEFRELAKKSGIREVEAMRALQWLENKDLLKINTETEEVIETDVNGKEYLKKGLPEKRFLSAAESGTTYDEVKRKTGLNDDEMAKCIGILKSKYAISVMGKRIEPTSERKNVLGKGFPEEEFLAGLPKKVSELSGSEKSILSRLMKRKRVVKKETARLKFPELTKEGKRLVREFRKRGDRKLTEKLTAGMIKKGSWKGKKFRRYDIKINVPKIHGGKRHFVNQAIEYARRIWLDMGFREMTGPMVQTSFWNFDALYTAQSHPVRDMHDTMFIKDPRKGKLPGKVVDRVRKTHEDGWTTGSTGWKYEWSRKEAKRNCMRTHTTVLSAKTIAGLRESDLPAKFFSFGKNFRNETLDWSHLFELTQTDGIVIDPDANFSHLLGYLREFFRKMGFKKIRFRPAYFPYTEMSVEPEVFHPVHKKWIELGGSGMFRPEVVKPLLGKEVPVLAWGLGFERIITDYYGISDIRELYRNDIKELRETKIWL